MYSERSREGGTPTKSSPFMIAGINQEREAHRLKLHSDKTAGIIDGHTEKSREGGKMEYAARGGLLL